MFKNFNIYANEAKSLAQKLTTRFQYFLGNLILDYPVYPGKFWHSLSRDGVHFFGFS